MKRLLHVVLAAATAVAFTTVGLAEANGPSAGASSTTRTAKGSFKTNNDYTATSTGGAELSSLMYKGTLSGTAIDTGTTDFRSNGSFAGHGKELCDPCNIAGRTGAFTATYKYSGSGTTYKGTLKITRGFGKLARLSGGGKFKGNVATDTNSYSYSYRL